MIGSCAAWTSGRRGQGARAQGVERRAERKAECRAQHRAGRDAGMERAAAGLPPSLHSGGRSLFAASPTTQLPPSPPLPPPLATPPLFLSALSPSAHRGGAEAMLGRAGGWRLECCAGRQCARVLLSLPPFRKQAVPHCAGGRLQRGVPRRRGRLRLRHEGRGPPVLLLRGGAPPPLPSVTPAPPALPPPPPCPPSCPPAPLPPAFISLAGHPGMQTTPPPLSLHGSATNTPSIIMSKSRAGAASRRLWLSPAACLNPKP